MTIDKELIEGVEALVNKEYGWEINESSDYGVEPFNEKDSFGPFSLTVYSEPEDAIWARDLSDNFYTGVKIGVRNTLKVLKENPVFIEELIGAKNAE